MAVFYGKHPIDRALFDGIKRLGWVPGSYHMPTGNLFRVGRHGWANAVLTDNGRPINSAGAAIPGVGTESARSISCRAGCKRRRV